MKLIWIGIAILLGIFLFGCLGSQQEPAPTATPAAATVAAAATPAATVEVSQANSGIDDALGALGDASNATSDLDVGDMNPSDLDYVG